MGGVWVFWSSNNGRWTKQRKKSCSASTHYPGPARVETNGKRRPPGQPGEIGDMTVFRWGLWSEAKPWNCSLLMYSSRQSPAVFDAWLYPKPAQIDCGPSVVEWGRYFKWQRVTPGKGGLEADIHACIRCS